MPLSEHRLAVVLDVGVEDRALATVKDDCAVVLHQVEDSVVAEVVDVGDDEGVEGAGSEGRQRRPDTDPDVHCMPVSRLRVGQGAGRGRTTSSRELFRDDERDESTSAAAGRVGEPTPHHSLTCSRSETGGGVKRNGALARGPPGLDATPGNRQGSASHATKRSPAFMSARVAELIGRERS